MNRFSKISFLLAFLCVSSLVNMSASDKVKQSPSKQNGKQEKVDPVTGYLVHHSTRTPKRRLQFNKPQLNQPDFMQLADADDALIALCQSRYFNTSSSR